MKTKEIKKGGMVKGEKVNSEPKGKGLILSDVDDAIIDLNNLAKELEETPGLENSQKERLLRSRRVFCDLRNKHYAHLLIKC